MPSHGKWTESNHIAGHPLGHKSVVLKFISPSVSRDITSRASDNEVRAAEHTRKDEAMGLVTITIKN